MPETSTNPKVDAMNVPDPLKKNLEWYIANQKDLSAKYDGKILLIADQNLIGAFDSMEDAYVEGAKRFEIGAFSLQPCSPDPDSYTLTICTPYLVLT